MTDYISLAMQYGGYTSMDQQYLTTIMQGVSDQEKKRLITPPPSVLNAYFAEIYQKQSPKAATDYYYQMSKALGLCQANPSFFKESLPFVRLNVSGKAYGYVYQEAEQEEALVFSEVSEPVTEALLFELAMIFPHYLVYQEANQIKMCLNGFTEQKRHKEALADHLLSQKYLFEDGTVLLTSYNQEELIALAKSYSGQRCYGFHQRQYQFYISN
ncbi:cystathionine beta-lyase [Streptococcus halichoeri]|uniref:cystathionine beta-lyase n=1 Tax=Streptococcus halichoeri TaxID=254785 RepID=UPI001358500F|nr:cystathionine beta-lyase [Streptococcus halichoeri]